MPRVLCGKPGIPPEVYFRMMMVGYLEGIGSEHEIAWRYADSISLREFLGYGLSENPPEHSTLPKTRKRLSVEAHAAVFGHVLALLQESDLLTGKTLGVDATTLEANAALRAIVRRADGTGYEAWLRQVAQASGIETPTREDLVKLDRTRPRKGSNKAWVHPQDPESRITKMKDGRTHLAHKFEQAVDLDTGAAVKVRGRRNWKRHRDAQQLTCANRRRIRAGEGSICCVSAVRRWNEGSHICL